MAVNKYKISTMNGDSLSDVYNFKDFYSTFSNSVISYKKLINDNNVQILLMYDVNGTKAPNIWGKDVYGFNVYLDKIEPFGKEQAFNVQKKDCSRHGTGLFCSNYYLIGGSFD